MKIIKIIELILILYLKILVIYLYTADKPEKQQFNEVDNLNLATYCIVRFGFTRDDIYLSIGEYIELKVRINRPDWTNYVQSNDFSFNAESRDYEEWIKIVAYVGERWVYRSMSLSYIELTNPDPKVKKE